MTEYIERESVYNTLKAMYCDECTDEKCQMCEYAEIMFVLDNLPIADVQPVKHGTWISYNWHEGIFDGWGIQCDKCLERYKYGLRKKNFCPNCGADMRNE